MAMLSSMRGVTWHGKMREIASVPHSDAATGSRCPLAHNRRMGWWVWMRERLSTDCPREYTWSHGWEEDGRVLGVLQDAGANDTPGWSLLRTMSRGEWQVSSRSFCKTKLWQRSHGEIERGRRVQLDSQTPTL